MIGYLRVSTEEQASSGLGLEAQRETSQRDADAHGWELIWYVDESLQTVPGAPCAEGARACANLREWPVSSVNSSCVR